MLLLLAAACSNPVVITPSQGGCVDYNFASPDESAVESEGTADGAIRVWRSNALLEQTGLIFDPLIEVDDKVVQVFEAWVGGETDDAFCYEPVVTFEGLVGDLQVRWFLPEDDMVPFDSVDISSK